MHNHVSIYVYDLIITRKRSRWCTSFIQKKITQVFILYTKKFIRTKTWQEFIIWRKRSLRCIFARHLSSLHFSSRFYNYSRNTSFPLYLSNNREVYNKTFNLNELRSALASHRGSSTGRDNIRYEMLKKLNIDGTRYLLDFYNFIWTNQVFPRNWKIAIAFQ